MAQPDAQRRPDRAARAVGTDHEPGVDRVGTDRRVHAVRPDLQVRQPRAEPDLAAVSPDRVGQDRLDQVLRADQRQGGADPQDLPQVRVAAGAAGRRGGAASVAPDAASVSTGTARARTASATPQARKISIVRRLMPVARGRVDVPGCRSTTSTRAPWRAADRAVARPPGPAPTTSTSYGAGKLRS